LSIRSPDRNLRELQAGELAMIGPRESPALNPPMVTQAAFNILDVPRETAVTLVEMALPM
jgi:hypothetical protein